MLRSTVDKEKVRKFARLIAVGTEISIVARDSKVSERTLRRWRKNPIFLDELDCLNQQKSKEAGLASQLQSTAFRWAISYLYSSVGKETVKAHIVGRVLARPLTLERDQRHGESENYEAFQRSLEIVDSRNSIKRRHGDSSDG